MANVTEHVIGRPIKVPLRKTHQNRNEAGKKRSGMEGTRAVSVNISVPFTVLWRPTASIRSLYILA